MEFEPAEYVRKIFNVKAVEVSYDNIENVAKWCKGRIDTEATRVLGAGEVKLPIIKFQGQGEDRGKEVIARLGSFIVHSKNRFRVYNTRQFHAAFEPAVSESLVEATDVLEQDTRRMLAEDQRVDSAFKAEEVFVNHGGQNIL